MKTKNNMVCLKFAKNAECDTFSDSVLLMLNDDDLGKLSEIIENNEIKQRRKKYGKRKEGKKGNPEESGN